MYGTTIDRVLPGKTVNKIYFNTQAVRFETDLGNFNYRVIGDCCSHSEFWDFFGVKNLIGSKVLSVTEIELEPQEGSNRPDGNDDSTQYYGIKIVAEHPVLGDVTSVFSFRNLSNGYYGGSLVDDSDKEVSPEITVDVTEAQG